jgi:hypothetical protein
MLRGSLERIALARRLVGGCAVLFGACAMIQQAQAEHNGGGGGIPVHTPSVRSYAMPQPRYKPLLAAPFTPAPPPAPVPRYSATTPVKERLAHTAAASQRWTSVSRTQPADQGVRSVVVGPTEGCAWRRGWDGTWFRTSPCS